VPWPSTPPAPRAASPSHGDAVAEYNFGSIEIDWAADDPRVRLLSIDHTGAERNVVELRLSDIQVRRGAR